MDDNWAEVRSQLDQVLASERAQRQARRRQPPSLWQAPRQWGAIAVRFISTTHMRLPKQRTIEPAANNVEEESTRMTTHRSMQTQASRWHLLPGLTLLCSITRSGKPTRVGPGRAAS